MKKAFLTLPCGLWPLSDSIYAIWPAKMAWMARPKQPLPNIQIFGYERGIHLIKGKTQRNIEVVVICGNVFFFFNGDK